MFINSKLRLLDKKKENPSVRNYENTVIIFYRFLRNIINFIEYSENSV